MGLLDLFRRKKKLSESESALMDQVAKMLFGGYDAMRAQTMELYELLGKRYPAPTVANNLTWMTSRFHHFEDKSAQGMVIEGQLERPDNTMTEADALMVYKFVVRKSFEKKFPGVPDSVFEEFYKSLGNFDKGATTDVIPGAYGEYGYDLTNPIPTRGVPSNELYLKRLRLLSGESFKWHRIGSFGAPNIEHPIDGYAITLNNGEVLCIIYISHYQRINSNKAPKGFVLE